MERRHWTDVYIYLKKVLHLVYYAGYILKFSSYMDHVCLALFTIKFLFPDLLRGLFICSLIRN